MNKNINILFERWEQNAIHILSDNPDGIIIRHIFFSILNLIENYKIYDGACYSTSAIQHVCYQLLHFNSELCIGEVYNPKYNIYFDHAWVELDGEVYDVSAFRQKVYSDIPVIKNYNVDTCKETQIKYGVKYKGLNPVSKVILQTPFDSYMRHFPLFKHGLWDMVNLIEHIPHINVNDIPDRIVNKTWIIK